MGGETHDLLLTACAAAGFTPRIIHHALEWFAVAALVAERFGVCRCRGSSQYRGPMRSCVCRCTARLGPTGRSSRRGGSAHPAVSAAIDALRAVAQRGSQR